MDIGNYFKFGRETENTKKFRTEYRIGSYRSHLATLRSIEIISLTSNELRSLVLLVFLYCWQCMFYFTVETINLKIKLFCISMTF